MELNITDFYNSADPAFYSASKMELGDNAGRITWDNANVSSMDYQILDTEEKRIAFRQYVQSFGAWEKEEIAAWSDIELNALLIQMISGDIRESCLDDDRDAWDEYQEQSSKGQVAGRLFKGFNDNIYYYIGE